MNAVSNRSVRAVACPAGMLFCMGCSGGGCDPPWGPPQIASAAGGGWVAGTVSASSASAAAVVSTGFGSGAGSGGGDAGVPCQPYPIPSEVPAGWVEYTDWSCDCRFYVPPSKDLLPPPIAWEPCPLAPNGINCKVMVIDWTVDKIPIFLNPHFDRNPNGTAILSIVRQVNLSHSIHVVADVDGPVRTAMISVWAGKPWGQQGCYLNDEALKDGKHIIDVAGDNLFVTPSDHQGVIGGSIDELWPPVLAHYVIPDNPFSDGWACSENMLARLTKGFVLSVFPWDMSSETFVTSPAIDPQGLHANHIMMQGNALFWTTSTTKLAGINVWDSAGGTRPFIRWLNDYTKGAGNLGTDGIDLVWSYGEGKAPNDTVYPARSIMTAPFTTDPTKLQSRRLRSQPDKAIAGFDYKVGCGFAIHRGAASDVQVVRLSDGWAWDIPTVWPDQVLSTPVGVTCEEAFILGTIAGRSNIARVRLDSLGPGIPPD